MQSFLKTLILTILLHTSATESHRKASDGHILLRFKSSVGDPSRMLSSWIPSSDHCSWSGVSCDSSSRVSSLRLPGGNCPTTLGHFSRSHPPPSPPPPLLRRRRCDRSRGWLNGTLPASLGGLHHLTVLSLPFHQLGGEIPYGILSLQNMKVLDLEGNIFSCRFGLKSPISDVFLPPPPPCTSNPKPPFPSPESILLFKNDRNWIADRRRRLGSVILGDVSFSDPSGTPFLQSLETITSPPEAPQEPSGAPTLHRGGLSSIQLASLISASAIGSVLLTLLLIFVYIRKWVPLSKIQVMELREITLFSNPGVHLTFDTIVQATSHFSAGKCIGSGGFGATYKAEVSPGVLVAVKRVSVGRFVQGVQQFHAEIKTLGRIRHPNLVTLIGYHASDSEMFLIYNYLPGGNLERFIQERREGGAVEWTVVHRVASQIAAALAYLHDDCVPRVLHRDVKPSNILLDGRLNAYLSDFGLSRLMGASETHATTGVAGTFGYVAPEYAMTCRVSEKSDVYSYGVVLLELISDKKALDPSFSDHGNGFNIVSWACMLLRQGRAGEVFTKRLWEDGPQSSLVALLHLAVMCTVDSLAIRPTMRQVVQRLTQLG